MRLTDEKIDKVLRNRQFNGPLEQSGYAAGIYDAREFYENQVCETCNKNVSNENSCIVETIGVSVEIENFGCTQWEKKQ